MSAAPATLFSLISSVWASLLQGQMPEGDLLRTLISKALGYGIMAGACGVKLPQIRIIHKNASAEGMSTLSAEIEVLSYIIHAAYGYLRNAPFNTYGEMVIIAVQAVAILALIYRYSKASTARVLLVTSALVGLVGFVLSGQIPMPWAEIAFSSNTLLMMGSRLPQIFKNFSEKSTGQLSMVTMSVNVVGGAVRIFTTIQENGGATMLQTFVIGTALNAVILSQIIFYGTKGSSSSKKEKSSDETKKGK